MLASVLLPALGGKALPIKASTTQGLATQIFGSWVWPFELLSLVLLTALIAALAISRMPATSPEGEAVALAEEPITSPEHETTTSLEREFV
jgi:hypothetical protein